jgi:hypothetical protein
MVDGEAPTCIALYTYASGAARRVAEFRWNPKTGVSLTVFDPEWGALAKRYYDQGAPLDAEQRSVPRSEAAAFMGALLQPSAMTYYSFIDESPTAT